MNWSLISATNNSDLLEMNLLASPEAAKFREFMPKAGARTAGQAYNEAWRAAKGDILVFAHQDVFLPPGWTAQLQAALDHLAEHDAHWGVLGIWGRTTEGYPRGHTYCTGLCRMLGAPFAGPVQVRTLDEIVLVMRRDCELRFDEQLPGFHLYGTDICLQAENRALNCYVIPAFCVHNTRGLKYLPLSFWQSYIHLRAKWRSHLPVQTPCTTITCWGWPLVRHGLESLYQHAIRRRAVGCRVPDPAALYRDLAERGGVQARPVSNDSLQVDLDAWHGQISGAARAGYRGQ